MTSPIIIAGMHRSGTSFTASLLSAAGVHIGDRLMPAGRGNALGHFENLDFVEFHERLFQTIGEPTEGWLAPSGLRYDSQLFDEAAAVIAKNAKPGPWGWKDPRSTVLLDFWLRVCPGAKFVFVFRSPEEVVDSLFRRRDRAIEDDPRKAVRAWMSHNTSILTFARAYRHRCVVANLAAIVREPQAFLSTVSARFSIRLDTGVPTPYYADQLRSIPRSAPESVLLRFLIPEVERVFTELEMEADLPGAALPASTSASEARALFLHQWLARYDEHVREVENMAEVDAASIEESAALANELCQSIYQLRRALDRAQATHTVAHHSAEK